MAGAGTAPMARPTPTAPTAPPRIICSPKTAPVPGEEGKQGTPPWERWHGKDAKYTAGFLSGSALPQAIGVCPGPFGPACQPPAVFARWLAGSLDAEPHPHAVAAVTESSAAAMQKGHDKEGVVLELVFVETGVHFVPSDSYFRVDAPWLRGSPDGEAVVQTVDGHPAVVILEVKNKLRPPYGGKFPDAPEPMHYWQCIFNLYVTDADACLLVVAYIRDDKYLVGPKREEDVKMADAWAANRGGLGTTATKSWTIYRNDAAVEDAVSFVERCRRSIKTAHLAGCPGLTDPAVLASPECFVDGMLALARGKGMAVDLSLEASMGLYVPGFDTAHFKRGAGLAAFFDD